MIGLCIDLCSGLGGFSQAFVKARWEVITVDIEEKFNPTIVADVRELSGKEIMSHAKQSREEYERIVILASPPCTAFSVAGLGWHWKDGIPDDDVLLGLSIFFGCLRIIKEIHPHKWFIENPRGMLRTIIGKPKTTIRLCDFGTKWMKPTDLWGTINLPMCPATRTWQRAPRGSDSGVNAKNLTPEERAKMPMGLSQAVLEAVTN